jgi:hypothetical protein
MKKLLTFFLIVISTCTMGQTAPHWLQLKGVPFVDVRSLGAKGDGVANDTGVLQLALTNYKHVLIPAKFTFCSDALTLPSDCSISGGGTIKARAIQQNFLVASGASNIVIDGITLEGITPPSTQFTSCSAIELTNSNNISVTNCYIYNVNSFPIRFSNCQYSRFCGNTAYICGLGPRIRGSHHIIISNNIINGRNTPVSIYGGGIYFDSTDGHSYGVSTDCLVSTNIIKDIGNGNGIGGHAGERLTIIGNTLSGNTRGISIGSFNAADNIYDISIVGNTVRGTTEPYATTYLGISISGDPANLAKNISITGNNVSEICPTDTATGSYALRITDCEVAQVTSNTVRKWNRQEKGAGMYVGNRVKQSTISDNNFSGGQGTVASFGILIDGVDIEGLAVVNNTFTHVTKGISATILARNTLFTFLNNCFNVGVDQEYHSA